MTTTMFQDVGLGIELVDLGQDFGDDTTDVGDGASGSAGEASGKPPIQVLVFRAGAAPVVEALLPDERGSYLAAMQGIVDGLVQSIQLDDDVELWCNEEGMYSLPLNRVIPAQAPPIPPGFEDAEIIMLGDDLARPGEMGEWRIHGDFFLARVTADGEVAEVTEADIARYRDLWPVIPLPTDASVAEDEQ